MRDRNIRGKAYPFRQGSCRTDCQPLCGSQESMIRKWVLALFGRQIEILAKDKRSRL